MNPDFKKIMAQQKKRPSSEQMSSQLEPVEEVQFEQRIYGAQCSCGQQATAIWPHGGFGFYICETCLERKRPKNPRYDSREREFLLSVSFGFYKKGYHR